LKKFFLIIIAIITTLIIVLLIKFIFAAPKKLGENSNLKIKITETVLKSNKDNSTKLEFDKITDFKWNKLYIITPYVNQKDFCKKNGIEGVDSIETSMEIRDDINLLLFVLDNELVSYVNFPRNQADFSKIGKSNEKGFLYKDAVFEFKHNVDGIEAVKQSN
jgi:hypothetical protein